MRFPVPFFICAVFFLAPLAYVSADTFTVSVASGTNVITSANQTAVSVSGHVASFTAGVVLVTVTDSFNNSVQASEELVGLNSGNYSISVDVSSLADGEVNVLAVATPTGGVALEATPVTATKQVVAFAPDIVFYLLPEGAVANDCTNHPENFLAYDANVPTNLGVCALFSTTSPSVATAVGGDMPHFFIENGTYGPFTFQDSLGNIGTASTTVANIDTAPPVITITTPAVATTTGQSLTPLVSATDVNTTTLACSLDGSLLGDCTSKRGGLSSGSHLFSVQATDIVGNATTSTSTFTVSSTNPFLNLIASSSPLSVELIDALATTTIEVASGVGTSSVALPVGTSISRSDGSSISSSDISIASIDSSTFSNIGTNAVVDGALQFGVLGQGITVSKAITVSVYVGSPSNGQTFDIHQSNSPSGTWGVDGLVTTSCVVASGLCIFEATSTSYIAITHTVVPVVSGGGGGGGGGGGIIAVTPTVPTVTSTITSTPTVGSTVPSVSADTVGVVLGASTYHFSVVLYRGSRGDDVKALQERLRDEEFYTGPITSYFGALTESAVKSYQTKYGIEAVGIVGPQTRAELNKGMVETTPIAVQVQTLTDTQVESILSLLRSFGVDHETLSSVSSALGKSLP